MGHSEMLLAVAGLDNKTISEQTRNLADGDWSRFPAEERAALAFAQKQAKNVSSITAGDVKELVEHLGAERTLDLIWWICHCHYRMTVAEAFQLPLEKDNVFDGFLTGQGDSPVPKAGGGEDLQLSSMR
jgi:hypothetical protein